MHPAGWLSHTSVSAPLECLRGLRARSAVVSPCTRTLVPAVLIVLLFAWSASAQNNQTGTVRGTVADQQGGAMPGVTVTVSGTSLINAQSVVTDAAGAYHFEQLPTGVYKLICELTGFQQFVRENIQITAGFNAEVKVQMSIGSMEETVVVSGASPIVDTTSTTVSTSVSANSMANELPATRTMQEMVSIAPGVMPQAAPDLESSNLTPTLVSQGYLTPQLLLQAKDASLNLGGPVVHDKWWFFLGGHVNTSDRTALGYNDAQGNAIPAYGRLSNITGKSTYQLSRKYRLIGFWTRETQFFPDHFGSSTVPLPSTRLFTEDAYETKGDSREPSARIWSSMRSPDTTNTWPTTMRNRATRTSPARRT